jgi:hypothetical protein
MQQAAKTPQMISEHLCHQRQKRFSLDRDIPLVAVPKVSLFLPEPFHD